MNERRLSSARQTCDDKFLWEWFQYLSQLLPSPQDGSIPEVSYESIPDAVKIKLGQHGDRPLFGYGAPFVVCEELRDEPRYLIG